jgi:TolB-like protein/thioredoxin-like negative regulator of GroEL
LLSLLQAFLDDLRRRRIINVALLYAGAAWLLVQIVDVSVPALYLSPMWVTAIVIFFIAGFPVVLYLAWLFDVGPDGIKRTEPGSFRGLLSVIVSLGFLVVSTVGFTWLVIPKERDSVIDTENLTKLAVLPFDNLSGDVEIALLADGIPLTLINQLQRVAGLRVIDQRSSFAFKGLDLSSADIARALDVTYIVAGHILATGDQLSITTTLIDTTSGIQEWSKEFLVAHSQAFNDVFDIQDTVGRAVLGQLSLRTEGGVPNVQRAEPDAYRRYLELITNRDITRDAALTLLQEALAIDPEFAPAWVEYASWHFAKNNKEFRNYTTAWSAAATALALDPDNAQAISVHGWIKLRRDRNLAEAVRLLRKARLLEPGNVELMTEYSLVLQYLGRPVPAFDLWVEALELNPVSQSANVNMVHILIEMQKIDDASSHLEAFMAEGDISEYDERILRSRIALGRGNFEEVLEIAGDDPSPYFRVISADALYELNRIEESDAVIAQLKSRNNDFADYAAALIYGYRGNVDEAFILLDQMYENDNPWVIEIRRLLHEFRHLQRDPRWEPFLERVGVSEDIAREALGEN